MIPDNATATRRRALFVCDGGPDVGGGHLMRCLSLARALGALGAACAFMSPPEATPVLDAFCPAEVERLPANSAAGNTLVREAVQAAAAWRADVVVVDHYRLGADQETALRSGGQRIAVIDDLERAHDCDLLIDVTLGRGPEAYAGRVPGGAQVLTGPGYALLRPEYAALRAPSLARRRPAEPPRRLLVSLGLTDVRGITGRVMHLIQPLLDGLETDVVAGSGAGSLTWLRHLAERDPAIRLHVDTHDMAALIAAADIGVGAGGSSTWERAALGLPALSLVVADNQLPVARELERRGAALVVETRARDFPGDLTDAFARLVGDGALRARLSSESARLCDGLGARRAAEAVLGV